MIPETREDSWPGARGYWRFGHYGDLRVGTSRLIWPCGRDMNHLHLFRLTYTLYTGVLELGSLLVYTQDLNVVIDCKQHYIYKTAKAHE